MLSDITVTAKASRLLTSEKKKKSQCRYWFSIIGEKEKKNEEKREKKGKKPSIRLVFTSLNCSEGHRAVLQTWKNAAPFPVHYWEVNYILPPFCPLLQPDVLMASFQSHHCFFLPLIPPLTTKHQQREWRIACIHSISTIAVAPQLESSFQLERSILS